MSAPAIHVHSLTKEELQYEVTIRSEQPEPTVEKLRKQLKKLLVEIPAEEIVDAPPQSEDQFLIVQHKVHDLGLRWSEYEESKDRGTLLRVRALAGHLYFRLSRIPEGETSDMRLLREKELLATLSYVDKLNMKVTDAAETAEATSAFVSETAPDTHDKQKIVVECTGPKVPIAKWGIRFDGISDVRSFLERIQELKAANSVGEEKLFVSASELFVDQGLLWFRGIKDQVHSWSELATLLLEEFNPIDYDYRLLGEIRARTQGVDEPIHIYFSIMNCMVARLKNQMSEQDLLEILLHNIRPSFAEQLALVDITSIASLKEKCRKLEAARQRSEFFIEPTKSSSRTLNPTLAYKGTKPRSQLAAVSTQQQSEKFSQPRCYKCGGLGHFIRDCRRPTISQQVKCFNCGELGYTIRNCPKCKGKSVGAPEPSRQNSKN